MLLELGDNIPQVWAQLHVAHSSSLADSDAAASCLWQPGVDSEDNSHEPHWHSSESAHLSQHLDPAGRHSDPAHNAHHHSHAHVHGAGTSI